MQRTAMLHRIRMLPLFCGQVLLAVVFSSAAYGQADRVLQRFPFEVVLDISWRGEDIRIRRVLECSMRERLHPFVWDQDVSRISHVLPNDEVLIVTVPGVCGGLNRPPRSTALSPLPAGYVPIMFWIDSAAKPRHVERIVSDRYFTENPRRRFVVRRFSISPTPDESAESVEGDQSLIWLIDSPAYELDYYFVGVPVTVFPRAIWDRFPKLSEVLSRQTDSGYVDVDVVRRAALDLVRSCIHPFEGVGSATPCRVGFSDDRVHTMGSASERDVWRIAADDWGVVRYHLLIEARTLDTRGCNAAQPTCNLLRGTFEIDIAGRQVTVEKQREYHFYFDHARQSLIRFRYSLSRGTQSLSVRK
jgi:hypothetical protein